MTNIDKIKAMVQSMRQDMDSCAGNIMNADTAAECGIYYGRLQKGLTIDLEEILDILYER